MSQVDGSKNPDAVYSALSYLLVYRDAGGKIIRSGIVTAVAMNGTVTEVESEWGNTGKHRHAPGTSPYGGNISYYRQPGGRRSRPAGLASPATIRKRRPTPFRANDRGRLLKASGRPRPIERHRP